MPQKKIPLGSNRNKRVQNFILRTDKDKPLGAIKVPGSDVYNHTALADSIKWETRYYGRTADGTFVKKAFCSAGTKVYMGNDVTGALTQVYTDLSDSGNPESVTMQVAGNSRMYYFNGYDTPIYYEGDEAGTFNESAITYPFVQGVVKDARLWAFGRDSSQLRWSATNNPEDFTSTNGGGVVTVGNDKDSFIRRIERLGNYLYIFKSDSIWVLRGSTKDTYRLDEVTPGLGLLAQKACTMVNNVLVFVSQQDKQVYQFTGTPNPTKLSGKLFSFDFEARADHTKTDDVASVWDTVNNIYRLSFKAKQVSEVYNNHEAIFPTDKYGEDSQPAWSETYGARISSYSMWTEQGDHTLVTGRSDTGKLMYHNRGHNWDDEPMECILRTDVIVGQEGRNTQWNHIAIKGSPSNSSIVVRYYLDDRLTQDGTREYETISDLGEEGSLESITYKLQDTMYNYAPLKTGYNYGETISFELFDNTSGKEIEIEHIIVDYKIRSRNRNMLVG